MPAYQHAAVVATTMSLPGLRGRRASQPGSAARGVERQDGPVERRRGARHPRGQAGEVAGHEPGELARQVRVPVDQRIERRRVDGRAVEPAADAIALAGARAVELDPADLLADEVKDGHVGQARARTARAPRSRRRRRAARPPPAPSSRPRAGALRRLQVDHEQRRVHVRHVDEQHAGHPGPAGRVAVGSDAEPRAERDQDQRDDGAAQERRQVDAAREQPRRRAPHPVTDLGAHRRLSLSTPRAASTSSAARTP